MPVTKRTVSLSTELAKRVEDVAKKEKTSFSGALALLTEEALRKRKRSFRSIGAGDSGLGDLSIRLEDYLRQTLPKDFEREDDRRRGPAGGRGRSRR